MSLQLPDLVELSHSEKDQLIQRFFNEFTAWRIEVNQHQLKAENKEQRGKLAKNSQNSSKPPVGIPISPNYCVTEHRFLKQ